MIGICHFIKTRVLSKHLNQFILPFLIQIIFSAQLSFFPQKPSPYKTLKKSLDDPYKTAVRRGDGMGDRKTGEKLANVMISKSAYEAAFDGILLQ
jgi:hypothetical protein